MDFNEHLRNASLEEIKSGYIQDKSDYICLLCGEKIEKGIIYPLEGTLYEAEKYMQIHIKLEHQSVFDYLLNLDKKITGLSDHQKNLMKHFYIGKSDLEIQKELGIGSSSTIRNHRFVLKEKERQAKVFLVLMELLGDTDKRLSGKISAPRSKQNEIDQLSQAESDKILKKYFPEGPDGPLKTFTMKAKYKRLVLQEIARRFEAGRFYSEKDVNLILQNVHDDFSTLRRYLIDYGFMERKTDGSQYWLNTDRDGMEGIDMDRKKELKQMYKDMKTVGGVYQIKNTINQKVFVLTTPNLKTMNGKRLELQTGGNLNSELQAEWNQFGEEAFVFEVLEVMEDKEEPGFNPKEALKILESKWLEILQPYGERGYNKRPTS